MLCQFCDGRCRGRRRGRCRCHRCGRGGFLFRFVFFCFVSLLVFSFCDVVCFVLIFWFGLSRVVYTSRCSLRPVFYFLFFLKFE